MGEVIEVIEVIDVIEVGDGIDRVKVGDRVILPFNIGCGFCNNCEGGLTAFCLTVNPPNAGAAFGYVDTTPYSSAQAELLSVPYGDGNALVLPDDAREEEKKKKKEKKKVYGMLSGILPTDNHGTELAQVENGARWRSGARCVAARRAPRGYRSVRARRSLRGR